MEAGKKKENGERMGKMQVPGWFQIWSACFGFYFRSIAICSGIAILLASFFPLYNNIYFVVLLHGTLGEHMHVKHVNHHPHL